MGSHQMHEDRLTAGAIHANRSLPIVKRQPEECSVSVTQGREANNLTTHSAHFRQEPPPSPSWPTASSTATTQLTGVKNDKGHG